MTQNYTTAKNNQTEFDIAIIQGEEILANKCHLVTETNIYDIPAKPEGEESIDVNYSIDQNGILKVTVTSNTDLSNKQTLKISQETLNLSQEEMAELIQKAECERAESKQKELDRKENYRFKRLNCEDSVAADGN